MIYVVCVYYYSMAHFFLIGISMTHACRDSDRMLEMFCTPTIILFFSLAIAFHQVFL